MAVAVGAECKEDDRLVFPADDVKRLSAGRTLPVKHPNAADRLTLVVKPLQHELQGGFQGVRRVFPQEDQRAWPRAGQPAYEGNEVFPVCFPAG